MLFFLFKKSYIFFLFLFSKKIMISYEKNRKTNNLNFKNKLLSVKSQKNKYHLNVETEAHQDIFIFIYTDD